MENVDFRITVNCPVSLTLESAKHVVSHSKPKWRLTRLGLKKLDTNVFECTVGIDARDISSENHPDLIAFRDLFLSMLSFIAMVPVRPLIKGTFTFPLGENKFKQLSLGPMNHVFPEKPILSFGPLIEGMTLDEVYRTAVWFIWQAMNASEPVHRFVNLTISYELIVGKDSRVSGSKAPRCNACGKEIGNCPTCQNELKIPFALRERAAFLFAAPELLNDFIEFRNRIFHGRLSDVILKNSSELVKLNTALLVNMRNYLGQKLGMNLIQASDIGDSVNVPDVAVTVFFETKP